MPARSDGTMGLKHGSHRLTAFLLLIFGLLVASPPLRAQEDAVANEYRLTFFPFYRINDKLTGFGYVGFVKNPDKDYSVYYLGWPGLNYSAKSWLQIWGGLIGTYTDNENSADKVELRPFTGAKLFIPNQAKIILYNFTRYEYRYTQDRDTDHWSGVARLRSRFGAEIPLSSRAKAWMPKTWYGLVDAEAFYRFNKANVDPVRLRGGLAFIPNDRIRIEFIYHLQYTRPDPAGPLDYTDNIWRVNVKIATKHGLLGSLHNPDADD